MECPVRNGSVIMIDDLGNFPGVRVNRVGKMNPSVVKSFTGTHFK